MTWILVALAVLWGLDALRLRGRFGALATLLPTDEPSVPGFRLVTAGDVTVDEATRAAATAYATREGLAVLDLVPADLSTWQALFFVQAVDPTTFRTARLARGHSAGYALLVSEALLERAATSAPMPHAPDDVALDAWAGALKKYAPTTMDVVVAPGLHARADTPARQHGRLLTQFGGVLPWVFAIQVALLGLVGAGFAAAPVAAGVALGLYHLQPLLALLGTAFRPRDLWLVALFRAPWDLYNVVRVAFARPATTRARELAAVGEALRPTYAALVQQGLARFFEPRRTDCPVCGGTELAPYVTTPDLCQGKPGQFVLERCAGCKHVFQNPRLSIDGLNYYYKDFYDGLGEDTVDGLFGASAQPYIARARMVEAVAQPSRWLDVGTGHGHFCCVARDALPDTQFDGLDMTDAIDEAARRRWIDRAYRGLFPEMAPRLAEAGERYDVVSMSHYLEHTREPRAEIAAARAVLVDGGHLFIEVPDPDSRLSKILGGLWMPWFQPQHQHLLSVGNLGTLLSEQGFEPLAWERGASHQPCDFTFVAVLTLQRIAPALHLPWRARPSAARRLAYHTLWFFGLGVVGACWLVDRACAPLFRRAGWSNTYRVVARRAA